MHVCNCVNLCTVVLLANRQIWNLGRRPGIFILGGEAGVSGGRRMAAQGA